jgi:FkbM family methyltransferase
LYLNILSDEPKLITTNLREIGEPFYLRNKTTDIPAFYDVFTEKEYDINLINDPKTIIDCGANIGLSTVFFKNKYPEATLIAVEPELSNYQLLVKNTQNFPDVHCLNYGVWNKSAILDVQDVGLGNWGFVTNEVMVETEKTIKAISISEIIRKYNIDTIDILKIDVEGSEREIFQENTDQWLSKVKILIVELHDHMRSGCSESFYSAMNKFDYNMTPQGNNLICYMK